MFWLSGNTYQTIPKLTVQNTNNNHVLPLLFLTALGVNWSQDLLCGAVRQTGARGGHGKVSSHPWLLDWKNWGSSSISISIKSPHMDPPAGQLQGGQTSCLMAQGSKGTCRLEKARWELHFLDTAQKPCTTTFTTYNSVQFSRSVVSDSL